MCPPRFLRGFLTYNISFPPIFRQVLPEKAFIFWKQAENAKGFPSAFAVLLLLRLHSAAAQTKIILHIGTVPPQHGLHHADVTVDIHGIGAVQFVQLPFKSLK